MKVYLPNISIVRDTLDRSEEEIKLSDQEFCKISSQIQLEFGQLRKYCNTKRFFDFAEKLFILNVYSFARAYTLASVE